MAQPDRADVLASAAAGDEIAFQRLIAEHHDDMRRVCSYVIAGTGAYEGWTFMVSTPNQLDPQAELSGIVYEGPTPPWRENLPLTSAE